MPTINGFLTKNTANFSSWILNVLCGISAKVVELDPGYQWFVCTANRRGVSIAHPCNAFELYSLYLGFIVSMAGIPALRKWRFAFLGIIFIYLFNVLRVVGLFLIHGRWPLLFNFMHKYFFQASAYLLIFALWYCLLKNDESPS